MATSFPVGAAITYGLEPEIMMFLRFALATLLFAPYVAWRHGLVWPAAKTLAGYAAIGACLATFFWCMFAALRLTPALNAAALFTVLPGIAAFYAAILVRERIGKHRTVALILGAVGALWVVFRGDWNLFLGLAFNKGDLIFLAGMLAMGLYTPLVQRLHRNEPTAIMAFWTMATGTVWLLLLCNWSVFQIEWRAIEIEVMGGIAYLAVFTTIISFFIIQHATLRLGPTRVMSYTYLTPAFVVLIDWALGKDLPSAATLPGIAIIVAAMFVVQSGAVQTRPTPAEDNGSTTS
ncbi:MAG: DMT family transporter [Rhodospirillaceae bacterium]|nr:DMT family transporter [Rhodospirillaceae bacterium]MBT5894660.1 DMT family transporter [Rhodospirillaceae bacterium]MBT7761131.1 DMT family transporter [Rhodospirillaceae bacterium]